MMQAGVHPAQPGSYALLEWVDAVADRFEAGWKSGAPPRIADYLDDTVGEKRCALLRELVKIDQERRAKTGETRSWEDYLREFPELQHRDEEAAGDPSPFAKTNLAPLDSEENRPTLPRPRSPARGVKWPVIEGYEILAELGHGGMGSVYKARQQSLKRIVALKLIRTSAQADPWSVARFQTEAEATARLQHPSIAQIFEVGQQDGVPYLAMEYVDGGTLYERLQGKPQPARQVAEMIVPLARAMQYAHEHGVVHRDLKPENVLLASEGRERPAGKAEYSSRLPLAEYTPKITDFGLAKLVEVGAGTSLSGNIVGTPNYMAPEQAEGKSAQVGPAVDTYALGAILYEMLTGGPPFKGSSLVETLEQVRTGNLVPPSHLVLKVPRDLETICLKSLARTPASRYASVGALADDLERYLQGKPILARPVGPVGRTWRWCRRHPTGAGLLATAGALLLTVVVASVLVAAASTARQRSQRREGIIQQLQLVEVSDRSDGWSDEAWRLVAEAADLHKDAALRTLAASACAGLDARQVRHLERASASWMAFDDTGRYLLLGGRNGGQGRFVEGAKLWDLQTDSLEVSQEAGAGPVAFGRNGKPLHLVARGGQSLLLWDLIGQESLAEVPLGATPNQPERIALEKNSLGAPVLALSREGTVVAAALAGRKEQRAVIVWDASSRKELFRLTQHGVALAVNSAGNLLATANGGGRITVWKVPEGTQTAAFETGRVSVHCLAFSLDGKRLAVGDSARAITVWDLEARLPITYCQGSHQDVYALAFNPDGTLLVSGGQGPAHLWDVASGRLLLSLRSAGLTTALAFAPDGRRVVVGSKTPASVTVWELDPGRGIQTLRGLGTQASRMCFSTDGRLLAALAPSGKIAVWDREGGRLRLVLPAPKGNGDEAALAFSPDGRRLACSAQKWAKLWDLKVGEELQSWQLPHGAKNALAFHTSGALLLLREEENDPPAENRPPAAVPHVCRIRNLLGTEPLNPLATLSRFDGVFLATVVTPDGDTFIAEGTHQGPDGQRRTVAAYDGLTGAERWSIPSTRSQLTGTLALDPTGLLLALQLNNRDKEGSLAEVASGKVLGRLEPFPVCPGPEARELIKVGTGDAGKEERGYALFRRGESSPRFLLGSNTTPAFLPIFSRDGDLLAWSNADGTVSVCDLQGLRGRMSELGLEW
jgi:WD40 repeat protein